VNSDDLYQYFGTVTKIKDILGISRQTFYSWIERGYIPLDQQKKIESLTKGKLKALIPPPSLTDVLKGTDVCLPLFRFYDKKHGMCEVESLHFKKTGFPRIVYIDPNNKKNRFSAFSTTNLMQAVNIIDSNGKNVYERDILLLKNNKKFIFNNIEMIGKLKKLGKFKIIGNVFE